MEGTQKDAANSVPIAKSPDRNRIRKDAEKLTLGQARESLRLKLSKR